MAGMIWTTSSSIQRLPIELLSYIFVLGTHSHRDRISSSQEPNFDAESIKTPLIFASVSHHWRSVALNTPALWTSLCITAGSLESNENGQPPTLNTSHITSYLSLSRTQPLDVLLDARDIGWDFQEPEIPNFSDHSDYTPPFSSQSISVAISLLLPHLSRWKTMVILTDTWAPMYTALNMINGPLTINGAPLLEALTLMRCNDFVSHSAQFQPRHMRLPLFLKPTSPRLSDAVQWDLLPRLRSLSLRGVHVCWSSLSTIISERSSLVHLDLSSHCLDVRPSLFEFRAILSSCPLLQSLIVNGSGFCLDKATTVTGYPIFGKRGALENAEPVWLPHLDLLHVGYRSGQDARQILGLLSAPKLRTLVLEDATHPGEIEEVNASNILDYIASGSDPVGPGASCHYVHACSHTTLSSGSHHLFPLLEQVTLKGVKSGPQHFQRFFESLPGLKSVALSNISAPMSILSALLPCRNSSIASDYRPRRHSSGFCIPISPDTQPRGLLPTASTSTTQPLVSHFMSSVSQRRSSEGILNPLTFSHDSFPCPKLEHLSMKGSALTIRDLDFVVAYFARERSRLSFFRRMDIYLETIGNVCASFDDVLARLGRQQCQGLGNIVTLRYSSPNSGGLELRIFKSSYGLDEEEVGE